MVVLLEPLPLPSMVAHSLERIDYEDTFSISLPRVPKLPMEELATLFFQSLPTWFMTLFKIRNFFAAMLGLKTGNSIQDSKSAEKDGESSIFQFYGKDENEILLGTDDSHLDFRLSLIQHTDAGSSKIMASTVVQFHGSLGRAYFFIVRPFHKLIVPVMLRRLAHKLSSHSNIQSNPSS